MFPAYRILTPRLEIRCWDPAEAPQLKQALDENLEHLRPWMPWARLEPTTVEEKAELLRKFRAKFDLSEDFIYGVFARSDPKSVLGGTGLHLRQGPGSREIGYWIDHRHTGQGLATEVAAALTRVALEVDQVDRVEIRVEPGNTASSAVPKKLGYRLEAVLRRRLEGQSEDDLRDCEVYTLFATDNPVIELEVEAYGPLGERLL